MISCKIIIIHPWSWGALKPTLDIVLRIILLFIFLLSPAGRCWVLFRHPLAILCMAEDFPQVHILYGALFRRQQFVYAEL